MVKIDWDALLAVFAVSLGATVAVVVLVTVAMVGMSARAPHAVPAGPGHRSWSLSPRAGTALAAVCLTASAAIILLGLWTLVAT